MDLPSLPLVSLLQSLQALPKGELPVREAQLLLAYLGQDLDGLLETLTPTGARIRFEQGPVVTAEGQVPYPEGTALKVRVSPTPEGGVRLQTLEARPPAPPPLLAPLFLSEGLTLLARLAQADAPEALRPLQRLAAQLEPPPEVATPPGTAPQPATPGRPTAAPAAPPSQGPPPVEVPGLPVPVRRALAQALGLPPETAPETLSRALAGAAPESEAPPTRPGLPPALAGRQEGPSSRILAYLAAHPELPAEVREVLARLVRPLRERPAPPQHHPGPAPRPDTPPPPRGEAPAAAMPPPSAPVRPGPPAALPPGPGPLPAPESLEAWVREGLRVLGDPQVSPQEAPFHILQAKEQSAFFELPLPGGLPQTLQLWVEWQDEGASRALQTGEAPVRFLMGTRFSRLGETRVGFVAAGSRLDVRVWTEHPELLEPEVEGLTRELEEGGTQASLRVLPLEPGAPSLRALVAGQGWEGMA